MEIYNNGKFITSLTDSGIHRFELNDLKKENRLFLHFTGGNARVNSITMFDMGAEKLKYFGVYREPSGKEYMCQDFTDGGCWYLDFNYPVFTWLHHTLQLGWLLDDHTV